MASVRFEHVGKTYSSGHRALIDVNLQIDDGELMVIVGPSGCGKSTLLRALAGLEHIDSGYVWIGDSMVNSQSPQERNVAMVFQDYALYPTMSARSNLEFPLRMKKLAAAEIRARVDLIIEMLDLGEIQDRLPKQLSGGQRQRVAMGRALVREPSVFLLDEPLSNLDTKLRVQVRTEIAELQKRLGTTMIYVTHDQVEAMTLGQRITLLDRGTVQQTADPQTIYRQPSNPFVAGFVGSPPMNLYTSRLTIESDGSARVYWGRQAVTVNKEDLPPRNINAKTITWGARPESIHIVDGNGLSAVIATIEYLGHETLTQVYPVGEYGTMPLIVRCSGIQSHSVGATIKLNIEPNGLKLFAGEPSCQ